MGNNGGMSTGPDPRQERSHPERGEWPVYDPGRPGDAIEEPHQYGGPGGYGSSVQGHSPYSMPHDDSPYGMQKHDPQGRGGPSPYDMPRSHNHPYRSSNSWNGHGGSGPRSSRDLVRFLWVIPVAIIVLNSLLFDGRYGFIAGPMIFAVVIIGWILRRR